MADKDIVTLHYHRNTGSKRRDWETLYHSGCFSWWHRERNRKPGIPEQFEMLKGYLILIANHADTQSGTLSCAEKTEEPRLLGFNKGPDA